MTTWGALGFELLGLLVLVTTLLDIAITAFHPSAQSPIAAHFHRGVWFMARQLCRALTRRGRRRLLSWVLPSTIAGLLLFWLFALLVGFALLYAPNLSRPGAFASSVGRTGWGDALYFSGLCLSSIGFGDIVPRTGLLRAAVVAEGLCGLLVVGVAITYILSVFPVLPLTRVLCTTLNEETNGQADAVPMLRRYLAVDASEALAQRCRELATQLMVLADAHNTHPVLFYAHAKRAEQSFLRVLIVIQRLVVLLRYGVRKADYPTLVRDPRVVGLEESLIAVLLQLGTSMHLQVRSEQDAAREHALAGEYLDVLAALRKAGLRGEEQPMSRDQRAYIRFRLVTDPYIVAYWANTDYSAEELWGNQPPLRASTAPLYQDDEEPEDPRDVPGSDK